VGVAPAAADRQLVAQNEEFEFLRAVDGASNRTSANSRQATT